MIETQFIPSITKTVNVRPHQVEAALKLLDEGNTIPFIARYRKEATGVLDEVQLRQIKEQYEHETALAARKETVRQFIQDQGQWTDELEKALAAARQLQDVEDIYLPFKPKKRTKASMARDAGLEPLADLFWQQEKTGPAPEEAAAAYVKDSIESVGDAIQGAANILAERFSESAAFRKYLRRDMWGKSRLTCTLSVDEGEAGPMATYADYSEPIRHIPSHRVLAINRGEGQKVLKVSLTDDSDRHIEYLYHLAYTGPSPYSDILHDAAADGYKRLIYPQMEREIRNDLTAEAEKQAIAVFAQNLRSLLLQPPFSGQVILGLDPGYRTGCKAAIIDQTGHVLDYGTFHLTSSDKERQASATRLAHMIKEYEVTLISIGNGTASYETEQFVSKLIQQHHLHCSYLITNEAGASVYSASELARDELPDLDVTIRGAVSIARRIQDPLAESVKIDPQSIGVGQYQHDVNQKALASALDDVVESVVNYVGVDLNTASAALLQHVAGLTSQTAANIVAYRNENGPFHSRQELLKVNRLGPATFTQCAGFLRIKDGQEPLDNTAVHPESYDLAHQIIHHYGLKVRELKNQEKLGEFQKKLQRNAVAKLAAELHAGEPTIDDILQELRKPGRDVRTSFPKPLTRKKVVSLEDLKVGTVVRGTVHNVVDFGAFVDFGMKTPGLVHRSKLASHPFKHPMDIVHVGDIVDAVIISVDAKRGRIGLSMKDVPKKEN